MPVTGDPVRSIRVLQTARGYNVADVNDLLARAAAELDDGRPAGPLIDNAAFACARYGWTPGYDVDAVDWFLDQLARALVPADQGARTGDLWRDGPVVNLFVAGQAASLEHDCQVGWNTFADLAGARLVWRQLPHSVSSVLQTADRRTVASMPGPLLRTVELGERLFRLNSPLRSPSADRGVAQAASRSVRDGQGHYLALPIRNRRWEGGRGRWLVRTLTDNAGNQVLYVSGANENGRAWASISFPDQRWFRFLVRGTTTAHAIMTAVDQAGNRVVRYRMREDAVEVVVNPCKPLTDELLLTIAISARWLGAYFIRKGGG